MRRNRLDRNKAGLPTYLILCVASLFVLYPLVWMVMTSLKTLEETFTIPPRWFPERLTFNTYVDIWNKYPMADFFRNSLVVVIVTTLVSVSVSCLSGYAAARSRSRYKKSFMTLLLVLQMFPAVMLLVPYYKMLTAYGLINRTVGLILPNIAFTMPFCTWMMMGYFNTIPAELEQAATIDGCNKYQSFVKVILPLVLPGAAATAIYSFIQVWNEYMFSQTLMKTETSKTLTVGIAQMVGEYRTLWNDMMAASVLTSIPLIIVFVFLQKYFISTLTAGAVKG
jgi:multiple sugar transport system permease protein